MDWKKIYEQKKGISASIPTGQPSYAGTTTQSNSGGGWEAIYEQKKNAKGNDINAWVSGVNTLISDFNTNGSMWDEEGTSFNEYKAEREKLLSYADNFRSQFSGNQEALNYVEEIVNALNSLPVYLTYESMWRNRYQGKSFDELNVLLRDMDEGEEKDWLTQYANSPEVMTQKDYENAISIAENQIKWYQENGELINPDDRVGAWNEYYQEIEALEDEIENLRAGHWQRGNMDKYGNLSENADFESQSKPKASKGGNGGAYDYINNVEGFRDYVSSRGMSGKGPSPLLMSDQSWNALQQTYGIYGRMTDEEKAEYNYIFNTQGREEADEYLDFLSFELDERAIAQQREEAKAFADEHPVIASAVSVPMNLMSGAGLIDVAVQQATREIKGEYRPINYNSPGMVYNAVSTGIRGQVAQNIADSTGVINLDSAKHPVLSRVLNGKSLADVYNLGMSMADSAAVMGIPGGTILLGGSAGTQAMLDALERGANDEQALFMGLLSGTFEEMFEKYSLDKLLKANSKNLIRAILKQGFIEGTEELNTTVANNIADIFIMAENSNYEKNIAAYIESGLSPEDAKKQALLDMVIQMGWDFVGGMASGGIFGAGGYAVNSFSTNVEANKAAKAQYGSSSAALAQESVEISPEDSFAQRMLGKTEKGKQLSGQQIRRLVAQNEKGMRENDVDTMTRAARTRLKELGETDNVSGLARIIARQAAGENLSRAERRTLASSLYGERVANEMNAENIESGEFDSGWTENIGTDRINARQYNKGTDESSGQQSAITEEQQEKPEVVPPSIKTVGQQTEADNRQEVAKAPAELSNDRSEQSASQPAADSSLYTSEPEVSRKEAESIGEQEGTVHDADTAYKLVQDMGRTGADLLEYAKGGVASRYLTEEQIDAAYRAGQKASDTDAKTKDEKTRAKATGGTGRVEGTVRGDGVTIGDIDRFASEKFNSPQKRGYRILSAYAKATGINIVLYNSASPNATDEQKANTGKFDPKDDTIYIDINSGFVLGESLDNMGKFALVRTFGHEFVHFIEKYNAAEYNDLRRFVFDALKERGENVAELIEEKRLASNGKMSYDAASREVVAEALTDILPDSRLMQNMAEQHKGVFQSLVDKLKEFLADIKAYFAELKTPASREARALQDEIDGSIRYFEGLVKKYDEIAAKTVENYQATIAAEEVAVSKTVESEKSNRKGRSAEEKRALTKKTFDKARDRLSLLSTERREYLAGKYLEHKSVIEQLEVGDHLVVSSGDVAGVVTTASDDGITIAPPPESDIGVIEIILSDSFTADAVISFLDSGGYFEKADGTRINPTETTEPKTSTSANGYTITDNAEYDSIDVKFPGKPSEAIRNVLKANKFRWNGKRGVWYGKTSHEAIMEALDKAYEAEKGAEAATPAAETNTPVEEAVKLRTTVIDMQNGKVYDGGVQVVQNEGGKTDGENADNNGAVREPDSDRQGDTQILEGLQAADVQGDAPGRDTLGDSEERGRETVRNGLRTDAAGIQAGRDDGDSQSSDIRRDDGISREEAEAKAEELHETVTEQIEQQSTEQPKGRNFVIDDSLNLPSGAKTRFRANVDAIKLIKQLETEGRHATAAEQEILSKYVGWGGLSEAFGELTWNKDSRKKEMTAKSGWEKEFAELRQLVTEGIITEEEYQAASKSTQNAHYTSVEVIKAMYNGLAQLGFKGGRMLEPSSGVGNFVGAMPASMSSQVQSWTMVELDRITGQIAKYLYPNSDVRIQGFEKANIPDNFMDVAIGNVPFGNYGVVDRAYPKRITKAIHNYFFAKSLDKVRPGGIVMFITSSFTMNGADTSVRQYIMDRADLLGAIRLPNNAFAGNAGTQVVTDILILKKRAAGTAYSGEAFLEAPYTNVGSSYQSAYINEYFNNHPEMVLGTPVFARGMYGANSLTYEPLSDKGSLEGQIQEAFKHIKGQMDYQAKLSPEKANFAVERAGKKSKNGGYVVHSDGSLAKNENGSIVPVKTDAKTAKRIAGLIGIRDAYKKLANYLQQGQDAKYIKQAREELNAAYDSFVKEHGYINSPANRKAIADDPDCFAIYALENYDAETKKGTKADIFAKDTISPNRTVSHVEDIQSGIIVSINQTGGINPALIAKLLGSTEEAVTRQLIDGRMAFKTRDGSLEAPERYLSGNVRAKLREAEALAPMDKDFENNVEELKKVIPADIPYHDIYATPGAPWVPASVYADFIAEMLGGYNSESSYRGPDVVVGKSNQGDFKIVVNNARLKGSYLNTQKWGTKRRSFLDLIEAMMASRSITVNDTIEDPLTGKKKSVVNKVETAAAQEKAEEITKEFQDWLWRDESRRKELTALYNEVFNALVTPKYDGSNLTVNGQNPNFSLRPHQADAVQRIISSGGNTLLAHKVGAGKTLEMAAAAMKLRELGIVKKPLFVVPKALVAQWGVEFMNYYPAAKLLVADEKSFTKANRMTYANRIANGDYDAVIISYEQFEKIPMSADFQQQFYQDQIDEILAAIAEERAETKGKGITVKEMEKKKAQLEKKIAELTTKAKDEDNINFEQLGIDSIFVDEAHNFKNLQYVSRMNNISGLSNKDGSQRAFDLYTKVRYLQQLNGGRGIVFATATPVMNSMAEMYIMQKYLQSDMLEQLGLKSFDAWAKQFGEVVNSVEIKPSGQGFRVKQTFSNFKNLNELQLLFRSFSDVLTRVPGLKVPRMKGGGVKVEVCEPGQFQKEYMQELEKRADNVKNVDPSEDNMLKITSDGRKVAYTQRMIDPTLPYEPGCKIYRCCENVLTEYKNSKKIKGTQIIFCDMATPKGKSKAASSTENTDDTEFDVESAKLYDDMRAYLVQKGIPAKEIAFIHEADTDAKKKKLFADVNEGKVRVLIGSTGKMGVGMNAQKRIVAIHHLDAPWRPGDVEQRDGRAFRQGNINDEVTKYTYVTEGSFDARLWDILDRKQHFINQIMNGEDVGRTAEDTGDVTLSAAEVKALASGNPLIEEHVRLQKELEKLENLQQAHKANISRARTKLQEDEKNIAMLSTRTANLREDLKARKDTYSEGKFSITIGGRKYTDKKDAGIALIAEIKAKASEENYTAVGSFAGFELRVIKQGHEYSGLLFGKQGYTFNVYVGNTTYGINHLIAQVEGLEERLRNNEQRLKDISADRDAQQQILTEPFAKQAELEQKRARFNEIMDILNPKEEQVISDDDTVQYQSREYLKYVPKQFVEQAPVTQAISSAKTSIKQIPALFKNENVRFGKTNVDIGGGRFDLATDFLAAQGVTNYLFDPYNRPEETNRSTLKFLQDGNRADTATCANVLNVIAEPAARANVILEAAKAIKQDGTAYFMVYEGDGSGVGRETSSGWQNNRKTADYVGEIAQYFNSVVRKGKLIIATEPVANLPKAAWEITPGNAIQYQPRVKSLTDREVLTIAAQSMLEQMELDAAESDALRIISERLGKLADLETERREAGQLYRQQQFGPNVDREAAKATLERMNELDKRIAEAENNVLRAENTDVLKKVLKKARQVVEAADLAKTRDAIKRMNDRRDNSAAIKKYRTRIQRDVTALSEWISHPSNKNVIKHVPDVLKSSVIPFISSIDFTSKRQLRGGAATKADEAFVKQLENVKKALKSHGDLSGLYSGYADLPPNFNERLEQFIEAARAITSNGSDSYVINRMSSEELKALSEIVRSLKKLITNFNLFHANAMYQHVYESGDNSIEYMSGMKNAGMTNAGTNFVLWQTMRPAYAFERFGKGGEAIYDGLRRGQGQLAFNTKTIVDFSNEAYTAEEVNAWEKDYKTFTLGEDEVKMPVSAIMSLYELSKRPQALGHILGGGIRVATYKAGRAKISDTGHAITPEELTMITSSLSERQKEVADKLQKFMAEQGGKWGNHVSVKRWGEEMFGEEHYFPINSDGRHLNANADEHPSAASLYALLNMGFTKELQEGANNRIILYSIFDVFANHMASMAQYNALALPVLDALKWFNYQQKDADGKVTESVREQMDRVYGVPEESRPGSGRQGYAQSFVMNVLKAFNGTEAQGIPTDETGIKSLRNYNMAQVAFNLRVVMQQPLAITRAALLVDYDSIIKGMNPKQAKQNIEEMRKYSGIAAWKALGFYDTNISRGVTSLIKHDDNWRDTVSEWGMKGAEVADTLTWAGIWSACKEQVKKTQKLKPGDEGFFEAVTALFEDVVYKTQVVDSVLTKAEYLRSKGFFTRATASFMSEPVTSASMLLSAADKYGRDIQQGMTRQEAWRKNAGYIGRVAYVYGIGAVLLAAVQAVADAFRDDDEYQNFWEKWGEAFIGNVIDELMPFNKLPLVSDFYDLAKELLSIMGVDTYGNPPQSVFMQWYDSLIKGTEIIWDKITGEDTNYTWYGGAYKLLQAVSGMFGLPMAAATREIVSAWNNTFGAFAPSLKIKSYEPSETAQIKYAYQDGYLTAEEARRELLDKGLADNNNEAYWMIQEWESGDESYSRYDVIYDVVRNGGNFNSAMKELTSHGYTEQQVISQIKSQVGKWYRGREISKTQAINMLSRYVGMESEEITKTVNKWSAELVTGIAYDDIKDEYLAGNITATRAAEMYVRYGGMSKEDAAWRVKVYDWQAAGFDIDDSNKSIVIDYETYCQPAGIDMDTYYDAYLFYKDSGEEGVSYSKPKETMPYINSLPLTASQKTALALCWWAESTVNKYKLW